MPELPEIETVVNGLRCSVTGAVVTGIVSRVARLRNKIPDSLSCADGAVITKVTRRAKYIVMHLDNERHILFHLGMSGALSVVAMPYSYTGHDHIIISLDTSKAIVLNDPRKFSIFSIESTEGIEGIFSNLGYEPDKLNLELLTGLMRGKRSVKTILTDSSAITGIGNIYVSEILFHAGIDPRRAAGSLSRDETEKLLSSIRYVLRKAISLRGSTIRNYRDSNGMSGEYQKEFLVYNRAGCPCIKCGNYISKIKQHGRVTYLCESCQASPVSVDA